MTRPPWRCTSVRQLQSSFSSLSPCVPPSVRLMVQFKKQEHPKVLLSLEPVIRPATVSFDQAATGVSWTNVANFASSALPSSVAKYVLPSGVA